MGDHVRTQCRDAAVTLGTGLTTTGTRVFAARPKTRPIQASELPCLLVYTNEEETELVSGQRGARRKVNACQLMVSGYAAGVGDIDKTLDTISKEVEAALEAAPTLSGKAKDLFLTGTVKEDASEGEQPTWMITLTFTCEYHTREGVPDTPLA